MNDAVINLNLDCWNIEGLSKYESSVDLINFVKCFDIFGFCETWGQNANQFDSFVTGFQAYSSIRKKRFRRGRPSGGVSVFVKYNLIEKGFVKRIFNDFDECVVLLLDGKVLGTHREMIVCFLYISPEGSTIYNEETGYNGIEIFDNKLFQMVQQYPDADIMLAGDFNARCGDYQDILLYDESDFVFQNEAMYESDLFEQPKTSKDLNHNSFGLSLIELCKTYGIHILNGRSPGDRDGEITCVANDGCSIVDYFIVSSSLFPLVSKFEIVNRSESVHFH